MSFAGGRNTYGADQNRLEVSYALSNGKRRRTKTRDSVPDADKLDRHESGAPKDPAIEHSRILGVSMRIFDLFGTLVHVVRTRGQCRGSPAGRGTYSAIWLWFPGFRSPTYTSIHCTTSDAHPLDHPGQGAGCVGPA